ncbi:hypothetical protein Tco_0878898 [Tanacetum coccineum]|uniref:Uncharacterized protein n=1 Tax=Tanacetum coccineum TaxID=301880 RepID=A0ABQ5C274_9ASTR
MLKWVWRFYSQKCSLWTKVIKAIYGEDGNLNKDVSGGVRTCWTSIVHEVRVLQGRGINVADYIRLKLGNGENTRFWLAIGYEGRCHQRAVPTYGSLWLNKNATVVQNYSIQTQRVLEGVYIWSVVVYVELSHKFVDKKIPEKALIFDNLDSVGTPAGQVILFGTIPTTILDTTPVITPPTTQTDTTVIPTEIPIIAPTRPPSPNYTPASPDYSPASDMEFDPSEDPSSDHIPPLPAISPFLSSADDTTDSDTPDTPPSPTHGISFTETTLSTQRSPTASGALRRRVIVLAPG